MTRPLALFTVLCVALTTLGCAVNPATGGANLAHTFPQQGGRGAPPDVGVVGLLLFA